MCLLSFISNNTPLSFLNGVSSFFFFFSQRCDKRCAPLSILKRPRRFFFSLPAVVYHITNQIISTLQETSHPPAPPLLKKKTLLIEQAGWHELAFSSSFVLMTSIFCFVWSCWWTVPVEPPGVLCYPALSLSLIPLRVSNPGASLRVQFVPHPSGEKKSFWFKLKEPNNCDDL